MSLEEKIEKRKRNVKEKGGKTKDKREWKLKRLHKYKRRKKAKKGT
jgi:hypothetical protein